MKKILLLLTITIFTFLLNGTLGVAENNALNNPAIERFKRQFFLDNMVKEIEKESDVKIPNYVDMKYIEYMYSLSKELDIPIRLTFRLVFKESSFIDNNVSVEGAYGFMQVMPDTRKLYMKRYSIDTLKLNQNQENIFIGMHMLRDMYDYWRIKGNNDIYSWKLCLACYNAGIVAVKLYNGVPPYKDTIDYIAYILQPPLKNIIDTKNYLASE